MTGYRIGEEPHVRVVGGAKGTMEETSACVILRLEPPVSHDLHQIPHEFRPSKDKRCSRNLVTVAPAGLTPLSQLHGVTGKLVLCCWVGISQGPETDLKEGERGWLTLRGTRW